MLCSHTACFIAASVSRTFHEIILRYIHMEAQTQWLIMFVIVGIATDYGASWLFTTTKSYVVSCTLNYSPNNKSDFLSIIQADGFVASFIQISKVFNVLACDVWNRMDLRVGDSVADFCFYRSRCVFGFRFQWLDLFWLVIELGELLLWLTAMQGTRCFLQH